MAPKKKHKKQLRLSAYLAAAGVSSRRKAEDLIREGQVKVDGIVTNDPAFKIVPGREEVTVGKETVSRTSKKSYYILNKPRGYLSACGDPGGKPTVMELVPVEGKRLYPAGRLDFNAEGLVLMTDDGHLAHCLTHPRFQAPRTYLVKVKGKPEDKETLRLTRGIREGREILRARKVKMVRRTKTNSWFEVILTEGRYREIRRLFAAIGYLVIRIIRVSYGPLKLDQLPVGHYRKLTFAESKRLKEYIDGKVENS